MNLTHRGQIYINYRRHIDELAQIILLDYSKKIDKPIELPIPIFDIAEKLLYLKCDIEYLRGKLETVSAITIPAKYWILLNSKQSDRRIRYSLAHEIVHCLVEKPAEMNWPGRHWFLGFLQQSNSAFDRERVADYFASALLMPRALIVEHSKQYNLSNKKDIQRFADLFDISTEAMNKRLKEIDELSIECIDLDKKLFAIHYRQEAGPPPLLKPRYVLVLPPQSVFDHRFIRHLQRAWENEQRIYFLLSQKHLRNLDFLIELKYGDGFIFSQDSNKQLAMRPELDEAELLDFEHHDQYYKIFRDNTQKSRIKDATLAYTADRESEIPSKKLDIGSVGNYIEPMTPLHTRTDARKFIRSCQAEGKKVVIVTGAFDLITANHVNFLRQAKAAGDVLVVGIENDLRVKAFKGGLRPANTESQRVAVLDALRSVDFTFVIHGPFRCNVKRFYTRLHNFLRADILAVTEGDPHIDDRREEIESAGGQMMVIAMEQQSGQASRIIQKAFAEAKLSGVVFVKKQTLYQWPRNKSDEWEQLPLPLEVEEEVEEAVFREL